MRPLTDGTPKCLLPVRGTPILQIWLEMLRVSGIEEVLINVHSHPGQVRDFIERFDHGLRIHLFTETELLGSAGTVLANSDWVRNEKRFWVFYADVLTRADLNAMLAWHDESSQTATIGVCEVADPSRCGIVRVDDRRVVRDFVEKPAVPIGNLAFAGLMLGTPALLEAIPDKSPVDFGFDVLPLLKGRMTAFQIQDFLMDIGTVANYSSAQVAWPGTPQLGTAR